MSSLNSDTPSLKTAASLKIAAWRAVCGKCPKCGEGKLFSKYLKPVVACTACGEPFAHIRTDDAPAWLTIFIVGHVVVPLVVYAESTTNWSILFSATVWLSLTLILGLLILPLAKGFFLALMWRTKSQDAELSAP
jgi:uncharacterized protein (DUF983 family)